MQKNFSLTIGGVNGYNIKIPAADFRKNQIGKRIMYTYNSRGAKVILFSTGEFEVLLNKVSLSKSAPEKTGYIRVDVDSIYSDAIVIMKCNKNICLKVSQ